jgi:hypothetical protein
MRDLRSDYPLETASLLLAFYVGASHLPFLRFVRDCKLLRTRVRLVSLSCRSLRRGGENIRVERQDFGGSMFVIFA